MVFRGKKTSGFHCMTCGRELPFGRVLCKDCEKMHRRAGTKFEMSSGKAVDRMEHQS